MEKEELISKIREKIGENDFSTLSQRTIDSIVETMLSSFKDKADVTDDDLNMPVSVFKSFIGQYRHDLAAGIKDEQEKVAKDKKAEIEKAVAEAIAAERAKKTEEPKKGEQKKNGSDDDLNALIDERLKSIVAEMNSKDGVIGKLSQTVETFISGFEKSRQEAQLNQVRKELKSYLLDERHADREAVVNLAIRELQIGENPDLDRLKVEVEKKYESAYKEFYGDTGGSPYAGGAGGSGDSTARFEQYMKERQKELEAGEKQAETMNTFLK